MLSRGDSWYALLGTVGDANLPGPELPTRGLNTQKLKKVLLIFYVVILTKIRFSKMSYIQSYGLEFPKVVQFSLSYPIYHRRC